MKNKISTSLLLFAAIAFNSMLFTQAKSQCAANFNWQQNISSNPCAGTFTNTSTGSTFAVPWLMTKWNFGDGQTSSADSPVHTYSVSGTYSVCLTIVDNVPSPPFCTSTLCKNVTVICVSGIASSEQIDLSLSVTNPVVWSTDINYYIPTSGSMELTLFDIVGNKIAVLETGKRGAGMYSYTLNTDSYSKGIYFIHLDFEGATITKKIIIAE